MSNPTTPAAGPVFQEGDRIVCADGVARTVRGMAPLIPGEPAHVMVEDGTQWIAGNCRRANPADLACARQASHATAARVRQSDTDNPQWRAALADLNATHEFLKVAETNGAILVGLAQGEVDAARELEELELRSAPAESEGERALREEAAALFMVLSHDGQAHGFEPVRARGAARPLGWTYRTGFGHDARFGWVLAGGRLRTEHAAAVYRSQAEEDAASTVLTLTARGEGDTSVVDALAHASLAELREALDRLRDRAARTRGTHPRYVLDEGVRAALGVLAAAHFAEVPNDFNPNAKYGAEDHDWNVTGLVVEPAANGHVTAYWVERGRYVTADGTPFTAQLRDIRRKFQEAGWEVVPGGRRVVTAYRPAS
ncbi:hypothetical protein QEH48_gp107 [Streptomyces phage TurkishDelight]|uniref:Uncharacterized protein n=1 Tax=Streptomyces phage TurkishDelight TaxID=2793708 RepID=A0A7T0M139_9CAUD|nr:hypothetical protein QEH48_gp107 [Streptomyces phage TurkishDelight]QPL14136.1 hypothetical protein SEA_TURKISHDELIGHT_107 [Streptomyces phage TurkishDelight]